MNTSTQIWFPAWMAAARYIAFGVVTFASGWIANLGREGFAKVDGYDWIVLILGSSGVALNSLGAIMNGSWTNARAAAQNGHHEKAPSPD